MLEHPEVSGRDCRDCLKYVYNRDGERAVARQFQGLRLPIVRPPGTSPGCSTCPKVPKDATARTWQFAVDLSAKNHRALAHYLECRAVGHFPDDPIVRRHARYLRGLFDSREQGRLDTVAVLLQAVMLGGKGRV